MAVLAGIQTDSLKKFVEDNFPDEPQEGETIIDTVIRLLGNYKTIKTNIEKYKT